MRWCLIPQAEAQVSLFQAPNPPSLPPPLSPSLGWRALVAGGQEALYLLPQDLSLGPEGPGVSGSGRCVLSAGPCKASPDDIHSLLVKKTF